MSTKKEPAETAAPQKAAKPEPVAYMGPTLRGIATQYRVYTDGAPEALTEKAKALPALAALIVPVSKMAETRANLKKPGTPEYTVYNTILKSI